MAKTFWIVTLIILVNLVVNGCDDIQSSPKIIEADGQTHIACQEGAVWVTSEGGGLLGGTSTFKVSYTDVEGLGYVLRGIKAVQVSDVPKLVDAPMPSGSPDSPANFTSEGTPVVEGQVYFWPDGTRARSHNGKWEPVQIPNAICKIPAR
jgi:hypothetical protein